MKMMMIKQMDMVNVNELIHYRPLEPTQNDDENLNENYLFGKKFVVI